MHRPAKEPFSWTFWHPHQGLWNWTLVDCIRKIFPISIVNRAIHFAIILIDSCILLLCAIIRRVSSAGFSKIFSRAQVPEGVGVLYLDLGTHKKGGELSFAVDKILPSLRCDFSAYGFEASPESCEHVTQRFANKKNVEIINAALTDKIPPSGKVRLYKDTEIGIGDSMYRETDEYEDVSAMRLSDFLSDNCKIIDKKIVLIRMNIEGAEINVLKDLINARLLDYIDGFLGMWDDVSKGAPHKDAEFRAFLKQNGVNTFTFNARDLRFWLRRKSIEYHIHTHVLAAIPTETSTV